MASDYLKIGLDILTQFTGGRGGIDNTVVNYGIAGIFYAVLFAVSHTNYRDNKQPREYLLQWGFGFGLSRELFMLSVAIIQALGLVEPAKLHMIFPPVEHFLYDNAMIFIACGYMRYFVNQPEIAQRYLQFGIASNLLVYLASFWWWADFIQANPTSRFGKVWCDWLFHSNGSFWLLIATIYIFSQSRMKTRSIVTLALLLFTVSDFLKIPDMALDEVYEYVFTPIARLNYLAGIFILGYVYFQEFSIERKSIEQKLRDLTFEQGIMLDNELVGIMKLRNRNIVWINKAMHRIFGYEPGELSRKTVRILYPNDTAYQKMNEDVYPIMKAGKPHNLEQELVRKNGKPVWVMASGVQLTNEKQETLVMVSDISEHKQANIELEKSRNRFFSIIEQSPISILICDRNGTTLQVNAAWEKLWGVGAKDIIGYNILQDPQLIKLGIMPDIEKAFSGEAARIPPVIYNPAENLQFTGPEKSNWVSSFIYPIKQATGEISEVILFQEDVTESKVHKDQIHRLAQIYAALAQTNRVARQTETEKELFQAVCRIAVEQGGIKMAWIGMTPPGSEHIEPIARYGEHLNYLDDLFVSVSSTVPEGCGPTGLALREGRAIVVQDFQNNPTTEPWRHQAQQIGKWHATAAFPIRRAAQPYAVLTLYHADRNTFDELIVSLLEEMVADIGFTLDIFDKDIARNRAIQTLQVSEARFRLLVEQSVDGILVHDPQLRYVEANPAACRMLGYSREEMLKLTVADMIEDNEIPRVVPDVIRLSEGQAKFSEYRCRRKDGSVFIGEVTGCALPDGCFLGILRDVSERKQAEEKLRLTSRVFESTLEGILITDAHKNIVEVNEAFTHITGYTRAEVMGKNPRLLKSGHQDAAFYVDMWQDISNTGHWCGEIWNRRKDGEVYPEWINISAIKNDKGVLTNYVGISSDITLLKQHEKQLEHIAHYDALTGIPNRILLIDRMHQAQAQTLREQNLLAVCYLDLDGFKPINDTFGHEAGDKVLVEISKRIGLALRGGDTLARLGGDEFVILLLGLDDTHECNNSLDRLLNVIARPISIDGEQPFTVTASIGATLFPNDNQDSDALLRHADQAMYLAKQLGKNRYYIFDANQEMQLKIHYDQLLRIEQGFQNNEFELFYQPKIELCSYKVVGVEALIRWRHPERGILSPDQFLAIIENSPLESLCGEWVIKTAIKQLEHWIKEGLTLHVSINISANHLQSPLFVAALQQILAQHPSVPAERLQIEILETAALVDIPKAARIIEECAEFGVSFALDDFGTGYSSLSYLRRLPAETLKIDLSFVRDMLIDKDDRAIVKGVISLGHTFNRITVAEGVETQEHFELLRDMGCDIGQGYGIARPMPATEVSVWCKAYSGMANDVVNRVSKSETNYEEIQWDSKYEIGHERIDSEHRIFLGLILEVSKEANGRCDQQRIKRLLHEVTEYARFHFVSEENIMEEIGYPELESHQVLHRRLLSSLSDVAFDVNQKQADYCGLVDFLYEWFTTHTTTEDKKISSFINSYE